MVPRGTEPGASADLDYVFLEEPTLYTPSEHPKRLLLVFPMDSNPLTLSTARDLLWTSLLLPAQERVCAKSCDATMKRHSIYKPYVAFNVYGKPVRQ